MLFLAGEHSYPITRAIAQRAHADKLDGILYPSFFSLARTRSVPPQTVLGMSIRKLVPLASQVENQTVPNIALFGRPISEGKLRVRSATRLTLAGVRYSLALGPVGFRMKK